MGVEFSLLGGFSLFVCWHVAAVGTFFRSLLIGIWATEIFGFSQLLLYVLCFMKYAEILRISGTYPVLWLKCGQNLEMEVQ